MRTATVVETATPTGPASSTESAGAPAPTEPTTQGAPPADSAPASESRASGAPQAKPEETGAPSALDSLLKGLEDGSLDRDSLLKHPKLAAKVGEMVSRGRQEERAELERLREQERQRDLEAQRRQLRDNDPEGFAELDRQQEALRQAQEATSLAAAAAYKEANAAVSEWADALPAPLQEAIRSVVPPGKTYDGDFATGFKSFLGNVGKALNTWHKEELAALKKQALSDANGGSPVHDLGAGTPPARMTRDDVKKLTTSEINARWPDVQRALQTA